MRIVVVGAGMSGLATAFFLTRAGFGADLRVIEARSSWGGHVRSELLAGERVEAGVRAVATLQPEGVALCDALGMSESLCDVPELLAPRLVGRGGRLVPLPDALGTEGAMGRAVAFATTPLLSFGGRMRAALDLVLPAAALPADVSVGAWVEHRLGREAKESLVEPFLAAITSGDIDKLDPDVALSFLRRAPRSLVWTALSAGHRGSGRSRFVRPLGGMTEMVDRLAAQIGPERILRGVAATRVGRAGESAPGASSGYGLPHGQRGRIDGPWQIDLEGGATVWADRVVLAVPPGVAAELLREQAPRLAAAMAAQPMTTVASVLLAFAAGASVRGRDKLPRAESRSPGTSEEGVLARLNDVGGVVFARSEDGVILALDALPTEGARLGGGGAVAFRALVGGARHPERVAASDDALVHAVLSELRRYGGLPDPIAHRVARFERSAPLPYVGHRTRAEAMAELLQAEAPGVWLVGGPYGPRVSLNGCVAHARRVAQALSIDLAHAPNDSGR